VFKSWNGERARIYRARAHCRKPGHSRQHLLNGVRQPGLNSGTASPSPVTLHGARGVYGDYLEDAQGEDVVAGIRNTLALQELEHLNSAPMRSSSTS